MKEQLAFEVQFFGTPLTTYPEAKGVYAVLEIDDRYSPKVRLYKVATGSVGIMKILKKTFQKEPLTAGSLITIQHWDNRPAYRYVAGERIKTERTELWLRQYRAL